ncbi:response regulator [Cellulomonas soli]
MSALPGGTGTPRPLRLVVVDDQPTIRLGMTMILDHEPDLEVVGEAGDGDAALEVVLAQLPDVVLMDVRMPRTDGVEATRRIRADERCAAVRVVVLTTFDDEEYVEERCGPVRTRSCSRTPNRPPSSTPCTGCTPVRACSTRRSHGTSSPGGARSSTPGRRAVRRARPDPGGGRTTRAGAA